MSGTRKLRPGEAIRRVFPAANDIFLGAGNPQVIIVEEPPPPEGALPFLVWGPTSLAYRTPYPWWNASQAAALSPANCRARIDAHAAAGIPCFVRLWNDAGSTDGAGNFSMPAWKTSVDRYRDAGLLTYISQRAQDETILCHVIMDDINSVPRWGQNITNAEIEEMAAYSRTWYPSMRAWVRARTSQITGFTYSALQGVTENYLFGRGDVPQGGLTPQQWRVADCEAFRDQDLAAQAALNIPIELGFGLNTVNGGDGSSGQPGDVTKFHMSDNEIKTYSDILVPPSTLLYTVWELDSGGSDNAYWNQAPNAVAGAYVRALCDAQ